MTAALVRWPGKTGGAIELPRLFCSTFWGNAKKWNKLNECKREEAMQIECNIPTIKT
jgi:hypothetical protein